MKLSGDSNPFVNKLYIIWKIISIMEASRIITPREPLEIKELETPKPMGSQVLVKVQSSGVCHSDIHIWEGGYEGPGGTFLKATDRGVKYPLTPGHEIAGLVTEMGDEAKENFRQDEKVLVYPWIGEGLCPACRTGEENLCDNPRSLGIYRNGGYAEYVLVPSYRYLLRLPNEIDMDAASTLSCSALTAYSAVKNTGIKPDNNIVVVGAGGLGLMAIQLAKSIFGARIIALDLGDEKLKIAKENGADETINTKNEHNFVQRIMELTDNKGADAVIDFVNASTTVEADMQFLRRRAKVVLVGLFGGELNLNLVSMPTKAYRIIGSYTGTIQDMAELVSLANRKVIKPVVSDRFKLSEATEALTKLKEGKIIGRGVINP
jgi:propanol-preferring alcohol dehydrogenase